jgi:hypothetical protein
VSLFCPPVCRMDTSPILGFITRKQAAERCQRAERTLQRYWSKAIELEDFNILRHLKLHTEDEQVIEGPDVTKERIEQLKKEGRNPTWFVEADWVEEKYGPRTDEPEKETPEKVLPTETDNPKTGESNSEIVEVLKDRLSDKDSEIQYLRERLKEKNDLEKERNDLEAERNQREKEMNELMRNLGLLVGELKQGTLLAGETSIPTEQTTEENESTHVVQDVEVVEPIEPAKKQKQGTDQKPSVQNKGKKTPSTKRKASAKKKQTKKTTSSKAKQPSKSKTKKYKWHEMPTLNRFLSRK